MRCRAWFPGLFLALLVGAPAWAQQDGLVTVPSRHSARETLDRFATAVRAAEWKVFGEIDHAAAARDVRMALRARTVLLFGNPSAGTPAMREHATLALDLPMRVLVWQDEAGKVFVTRSSGVDIAARVFARHGVTIPPRGQQDMDGFIAGLVRQAAE